MIFFGFDGKESERNIRAYRKNLGIFHHKTILHTGHHILIILLPQYLELVSFTTYSDRVTIFSRTLYPRARMPPIYFHREYY